MPLVLSRRQKASKHVPVFRDIRKAADGATPKIPKNTATFRTSVLGSAARAEERNAIERREEQIILILNQAYNSLGLTPDDLSETILSWISNGQLNPLLDAIDWVGFARELSKSTSLLEDGNLDAARKQITSFLGLPKDLQNFDALAAGAKRPVTSVTLHTLFDLTDKGAVDWAQSHGAALVVNISNEIRSNIQLLTGKALSGQYTTAELARQIAMVVPLHDKWAQAVITRQQTLLDQFLKNGVPLEDAKQRSLDMSQKYADKLTRLRGRTIARTEVMTAAGQGRMSAWNGLIGEGMLSPSAQKIWLTAEDELVCPICEPLDQQTASINDPFAFGGETIPAHPNCLPGFVPVSSPTGIAGADSRWYDGEIIVIETAGARILTVTPNHPVLTTNGWVTAGEIQEFDNLITYSGQVKSVSGGNPDDQGSETAIAKVFESIRQRDSVVSRHVPVAAEDFHGDGIIDSYVDVVFSDRLLRNDGQPEIFQVGSQLDLISRNVGKIPFDPESALGQIFEGAFTATYSGMGVSSSGRELLATHLAHTHNVGLAPVADGYTVFTENLSESLTTDSNGGRDLIDALATVVTSDSVIKVSKLNFAGQVYNLQTGDGWYTADSIVVHNCRCDVALLPDDITADLSPDYTVFDGSDNSDDESDDGDGF